MGGSVMGECSDRLVRRRSLPVVIGRALWPGYALGNLIYPGGKEFWLCCCRRRRDLRNVGGGGNGFFFWGPVVITPG